MLHRIVVVGGGAGGLELATRLGRTLGKRKQAKITLVDANLELWSNLVYEHQAVFLSDCSITCSPSWNLTLLTTRVSS